MTDTQRMSEEVLNRQNEAPLAEAEAQENFNAHRFVGSIPAGRIDSVPVDNQKMTQTFTFRKPRPSKGLPSTFA